MSGFIALDRCATISELTTIGTGFMYQTGPYKGKEIRATVHKALVKRFTVACKRARKFSKFGKEDDVERIDSFNCRPIRGSEKLSNHGRGAAFDIFATPPNVSPPGGVWTPDETYGQNFARCFTDLGFTWGHNWNRQDDPHLEWSGSFVPKLTTEERVRTWRLAKERFNA